MLKPNMVRLAHELVKACQLPQHMAMCTTGSTECPLLTAGGAMCFHTDAYVDFLQQIAYNSAEVAAESRPAKLVNANQQSVGPYYGNSLV